MTEKDQIVKMSIIAVIVFMVVIFFTIPGISEVMGYYFCDNVEDIRSPMLKDDNTVKVRFDSVISVFDIQSMYYMKYFSENYYLLRVGEDEYIYVRIPTADINFWEGVTLYKNPSEAAEYNGEKKYALIGKIKRFSAEDKERLLDSVNSGALQEYDRIINEEMTDPDIYVDVINIKKDLILLSVETVFLLILAWAFIKSFNRYKELKTEE